MRALAAAFCLLAGLTVPAHANVLKIDENSEQWLFDGALELSQSIPADVAPDDVLAGEYSGEFELTEASVPNLNGRKGAIWVKVQVQNTSLEALNTRLVLKFPQPSRIDFFIEDGNGAFKQATLGSSIALDDREFGRFPNAEIALAPGEMKQAYIRLESGGPVLIPLQLFTADRFAEVMTRDYLIYGLLIGIILAIAIHSALTFAATREWAFSWFVLFALSGAGFIVTGTGIGKALLWPGIAFYSNSLIFVVQGIGVASSAMFLATYLSTRTNAPILHRWVMFVAAAGALSCFTTPMPLLPSQIILVIGLLLGQPLLFVAALILAWRGVEGSRTLLFGWTLTQAGSVWIYLRALDVVPYTEFNHFALPLAVTFAALLFSWALTSRARAAEYKSMHDALTRLPNRFKLEMLANRSNAFRRNITGVLQIDLDGFKDVNDTMGHAAGDEVLRIVARRIADAVHGEGHAYRVGGDEFVVLAERRRNGTNLIALANRIIVAASQPVSFRDQTAQIGASIGLAIPQSNVEDIALVIERADAALYQAKRGGKGRVSVCDLASEREVLRDAMEQKAA
ncbi:MAG: diguanylate cyclase [Pseudomonadota bacterium]